MPDVGPTHDISLTDGIDTVLLRLAPGGWRRRQAPLRGARISTGDYGWGDLSIWQHWQQFDWIGGLGADKWVDDAMFDTGVGLDTTIADQTQLSRDLVESVNANLDPESLGQRRKFMAWMNPSGTKRLYCVTMPGAGESFGSRVYKYQDWDDTWVIEKTFGDDWKASSVAKFSNEFVIGFRNGKIRRTTTPNNATSWKTTHAPKKVKGKPIHAMKKFAGRLYVAYKDQIYRRKPNWKVDGKTVFYNPAGSSPMIAMEEHLGFLYMASMNGHIYRTDGNNTFDIWSWDGGTNIKALRSFDGRLFVGTYEFTDDDDMGINGIYQLTGSAVTQLKRWGERDRATIMSAFTEFDRRLFYGASDLWGMNKDVGGVDRGGFGVAIFDPIEDAHSIWATNKDTTTYPDASGVGRDWAVDDVIFWRGHMHAAVRGHGNFRTEIGYRDYIDGQVKYDITGSAGGSGSNAGFLVSSNYDGGTPGLSKLWRSVVLTANLPENTTLSCYFSLDKGDSWMLAGSVAGVAGAEDVRVRFDLDNVRSNQLQYRLELDSTDVTRSPTVLGVTWAYLPNPEPNWMWDITLVVADRQVLMDHTTENVATAALVDQLAKWYRDQTLLTFEDIDNVLWGTNQPGVLIWDFVDDYRVKGHADDPREGVVRMSFLEVQQGAP